ncbi:MAG: hypothetical protein KIT69_06000 [Propionibacteriaceae bacterium]|nr:hypothetical protein [Propionibacteriaceae bacterium]
MTLIYPDGISTIGNLSLQLIPAIATPATKITLAEWNAGTVTQLSIRNLGVNGEQNVFEDIRLGTVDIFEGLGRNRISIDPVQVVFNPQAPTDTTNYKIHSLLKAGGTVFLAQRLGLLQETAAAASQIASYVYQVKVGVPNEVPVDNTDDGGIFMRQFKLAFQKRWIDVQISAS